MIDTERTGPDIGGIGPTHGSGTRDLPQHPTTPKVIPGSPAGAEGVDSWDITAQGSSYDGLTITIVTDIVESTTSGQSVQTFFGVKATVNAFGVLTKFGPVLQIGSDYHSGSGSAGGGGIL